MFSEMKFSNPSLFEIINSKIEKIEIAISLILLIKMVLSLISEVVIWASISGISASIWLHRPQKLLLIIALRY